jgi:hypothetical protein
MDKTSVAILNFFIRSSTVTATYRIMDADSTSFLPRFAGLVVALLGECRLSTSCSTSDVSAAIAVCITEVDERHKPTIQYGNMYRIDTKLYAPDAPSQQQPS